MAIWGRTYRAILFMAQGAAILCCAGIAILTAYDVVMRNVFNRPVLGASEMNQAMLAILLAFGLVICAHTRNHIRVTLFETRLMRILPETAYRAWVLGWEFLATWVFAALIWRHAQHTLANYEYTAVLDLSVGGIFMVIATVLTAAGVLFTIGLRKHWQDAKTC